MFERKEKRKEGRKGEAALSHDDSFVAVLSNKLLRGGRELELGEETGGKGCSVSVKQDHVAKRGKWRGGKQSVAIFWPNPISRGRGSSSRLGVCAYFICSP